MPITFEMTSEFRNRSRYPAQGKFALEINPSPTAKANALDPVCLAHPIKAWQPAAALSCTVLAISAHESPVGTTLVVSCTPTIQGQQRDFWAGCVVTSGSDASLMQRVWRSQMLGNASTTQLVLRFKDRFNVQVGQQVTLTDPTDFTVMVCRAPGWEDLGRSTPHGLLLLNETLNSSLTITGMDIKTRQLVFAESSAPGWLTTHQLTIRSAVPLALVQLTSQTSNQLTLNTQLDQNNIGDWLRLRLASYASQPAANSWRQKITGVNGLVVTVATPPPVTAPGSTLELLEFSYDNAQGCKVSEQSSTMVWDAKLEGLLIPNTDIMWSTLKSCSHLTIGLQNQMSVISNKNVVNSNNPYVQQGVWTAELSEPDERWIRCKVTQNAVKRLVLNIHQTLCLMVWLPSGRELRMVQSDGTSPQPCVPDLQVWATFSLDPIFNASQSSGGGRVLQQAQHGQMMY